MASEHVLEVLVRRHVIDSEQPFSGVLDGIFGGISQPDIGLLFSQLAASTSYEQFSSLVAHAQGRAHMGPVDRGSRGPLGLVGPRPPQRGTGDRRSRRDREAPGLTKRLEGGNEK
jgi:hypothetical protein